jgi:hypothetical protein
MRRLQALSALCLILACAACGRSDVRDASAAVTKAAASFAATADPGHTGQVARAADPAVKASFDTLTDTRPPDSVTLDRLDDLNGWLRAIAESELVYLLAGTGYADLDDLSKATDVEKINTALNRNVIIYAAEMGRLYDAQLAVMGTICDTVTAEEAAHPDAPDKDKTQNGLRQIRSGVVQTVTSLLVEIGFDGMSDEWRTARIAALRSFAPHAVRLLDATGRDGLRDAAKAATASLPETSPVRPGLRALAAGFAADGTPDPPHP